MVRNLNKKKKRKFAAETFSPHGLYLANIIYDENWNVSNLKSKIKKNDYFN